MEAKAPTSSEVLPAWHGRSIAGPKLRLVEFSGFLDQQRDAEQVSIFIVIIVIIIMKWI